MHWNMIILSKEQCGFYRRENRNSDCGKSQNRRVVRARRVGLHEDATVCLGRQGLPCSVSHSGDACVSLLKRGCACRDSGQGSS